MKNFTRSLAVGLTIATVASVGVGVASATSAPAQSTVTAVRAGHHEGFDRFVIQFSGPVPAGHSVRWVDRIVQDGSGNTMRVAGHAFLNVRLSPAVAHTDSGAGTVPLRRTYAMPNLTQYVLAGDFEGVVNIGLGYQRKEPVTISTLTSPSRLVIDVATPYQTTPVKDFFLNQDRFAAGTEPYLTAVWRPAIAPALARQALERLFAGPTAAEYANGLRMVRSEATGFTNLSISSGIARVQLTGGCDSHGSTFTIANEIMPTLKQFASVDYVKIYGPRGYTEQPTGNSDSIPFCLEP